MILNPMRRYLDLSFNKIKHIKNIDALVNLVELYFVQNRISKIENLDKLVNLDNLELGANKIRVIENLDTLTKLQKLWLGKNKITRLEVRAYSVPCSRSGLLTLCSV